MKYQGRTITRYLLLPLLVVMVLFAQSCKKDAEEVVVSSSQVDTAYTVVVICPMQSEGKEIKEMAEWACQNIKRAQSSLPRSISLKIEWHDEDTEDLESLADELVFRPEVMAVIGPLTSSHAEIMAPKMRAYRKPFILPSATSAELIRSYAGMGFMWALTESDITQCEVLLTRAKNEGSESVSLLAADDIYGQTFIDWFAFQATELGLKVGGLYIYHDASDLPSVLQRLIDEEKSDMMICAPHDFADVVTINKRIYSADVLWLSVLYADMAYNPNIADYKEEIRFMEGVTPCADPETAFEVAYKVHFGRLPYPNTPQYYDALVLTALALTELDCGKAARFNEAMSDIVATTDSSGKARPDLMVWSDEGIALAMSDIRQGNKRYNLRGATGSLDFDAELLTSVVHSVYAHWMLYNGHYVTLNYLSSDGSSRIEPSLASWSWAPSVMQDFDQSATFSYPPLQENWALLIAGSESWRNYRHQADVLNMYQILRYFGYDDDHIILIMKDDIANNPQNPNPGQVLRFDDKNVYQDVHKDYSLDDISADDIELILTGQRSERLPHVISATAQDNVLVFWSGHGEPGSLLLADRGVENGLTCERMEHLLQAMQQRQCYRKMLWLIETCYSASVAAAAEAVEVPGVLMMTAAGAMETSKASCKVDGVYRSNRFTEVMTNTLRENPSISYRDLYYHLTRQTIGSHVTVLNASRFDNLFSTSPFEFLIPLY